MIYYWEIVNPDRCGEFNAENDASARMISKTHGYDFVYRESDTPDGQPFVTVWDLEEENKVDPFGDIRNNS